jgi:glycosyltransferase involved in cell wall biosynthesis
VDRSGGSRLPRVFYVSYDGIGEPLGHSQVLAYLIRLAHGYDISLISFEKSRPSAVFCEAVARAGITWLPLRYHRRPPLLSTALDLLSARRALTRVARDGPATILHARSDVPALMALSARRKTDGRLLFDIRGFWADERVEGGLWRAGGVLYRVAKRWERRFYADADAIVTLTQASLPQINAWTSPRTVPVEVIPTCVDLQRFADRPERPGGPHAVWSGSIGTWYRFDLAARVADALSLPLTVLTRQVELARRVVGAYPATIRSVAPEQVPSELFAGDVGLCLIVSSYSKTASAPTRFAEYMAAGMPVLVTRGVGDLESLVEAHRVGVVLQGDDDVSISDAAARVRSLAADPEARKRCRRLACEHFDVEIGAARYEAIYARLAGRPATR